MMSAEDVASALMAMDDPEVRGQVAAGDLSAIDGAEQLTADEIDLIRGAAGADPEVSGYEAVGPCDVSVIGPCEVSVVGPCGVSRSGSLDGAISYALAGIGGTGLESSFSSWASAKQAQGFRW